MVHFLFCIVDILVFVFLVIPILLTVHRIPQLGKIGWKDFCRGRHYKMIWKIFKEAVSCSCVCCYKKKDSKKKAVLRQVLAEGEVESPDPIPMEDEEEWRH